MFKDGENCYGLVIFKDILPVHCKESTNSEAHMTYFLSYLRIASCGEIVRKITFYKLQDWPENCLEQKSLEKRETTYYWLF